MEAIEAEDPKLKGLGVREVPLEPAPLESPLLLEMLRASEAEREGREDNNTRVVQLQNP
jgi:hypothetical protein